MFPLGEVNFLAMNATKYGLEDCCLMNFTEKEISQGSHVTAMGEISRLLNFSRLVSIRLDQSWKIKSEI